MDYHEESPREYVSYSVALGLILLNSKTPHRVGEEKTSYFIFVRLRTSRIDQGSSKRMSAV